jgi:hypothetical protein
VPIDGRSASLYARKRSRNQRMAHPDLNTLFDTAVSFAKLMLSEQGEFYPFGATMSPSGEITNIGARVEGDDHPRSQKLIDLMTETFQKRAASGEIRAAVICYDGRTIPPGETGKTDAICCGLEHRSGETVDVFIPYKKTGSSFQYGETFAARRIAQFFVGPLV